MNELWRQPAAKPDPFKVRHIAIKDAPEGFHAETMRLIALQGYCLWRCHDIPGQPVIAVVESLGNYHGPHVAFTLDELEKLADRKVSTLGFICAAKKGAAGLEVIG